MFERARALRLEGMGQEAAAAQVLAELGSPDQANKALRWVHPVHPALNGLVVVGVLAVAWMGWQWKVLESSGYQFTSTSEFQNISDRFSSGLLTQPELSALFASTGVHLRGSGDTLRLSAAGLPDVMISDLVTGVMVDGHTSNTKYFGINELLMRALAQQWPVSITVKDRAYDVSLNGNRLDLSIDLKPNVASDLVLEKALQDLKGNASYISGRTRQRTNIATSLVWLEGGSKRVTIGKLAPSSLLVLLTKNDASTHRPEYYAQDDALITVSNASGEANFLARSWFGRTRSRIEHLQFLSRLDEWQTAKPGQAILLKINPDLQSPAEVVMPSFK
ncbi:hypothetical protein DKM44_13170 [Deinococcus irradiatisoli]|uniref:Uncharacterized protein n=2 Tax=Deinococcus irradiatisoli TaxID=2202254 RepID=A0A2Z3JMQ6_9DEIO|nr:hypothetical protein DKM44_13170 [Deinococcus irradiatisoli]